jgi:hypothetical protein
MRILDGASANSHQRELFSLRLSGNSLQPIAVLHVQELHLFELLQKLPRLPAVVTVALQFGDNFALPGNVFLSLGNVPTSHFQVIVDHGSVHATF